MKLPITEECLKEFETVLSNRENKPISKERQAHARIVKNLINEAYQQGYQKGINEVCHNG